MPAPSGGSSRTRVVSFFTAPTAFRAIKREDPAGEFVGSYDLSACARCYLAGERADPDTVIWAQDKLKVPVDRPLVADRDRLADLRQPAGLEPLPVKVGSPSVPMPGYDVRVLDEAGQPGRPRHAGRHRHQAAAAAGHAAEPVEGRGAVS
jgi:propionyl-CoA synthetase